MGFRFKPYNDKLDIAADASFALPRKGVFKMDALSDAPLAAPSVKSLPSSQLLKRFDRVRALSLQLVAELSDADASAQSMPDASPSKWHLAHTTWFFETFVLRDAAPHYTAFDPSFSYLYNSYYEAEGERIARKSRWTLTRPSLDQIRKYRDHVDAATRRVIGNLPPRAMELVELGCHHEEQHQELILTDILHLFAQSPVLPRHSRARANR